MYDFERREIIDENKAAANYDRIYHDSPIASYWDSDFYAFLAETYSPGDRVLDLGCGPGSHWNYWQRLPDLGRLAGMDISPGMIERAQLRHPDGEFYVGRVHQIPFDAGSFDVVIASSVLHHVPDEYLQSAFGEIERVLDEHGRLVGREPKSGGFGQDPGWLSGSIMNFRHLAYRLTRSREYPEPPLGEHHHLVEVDRFLDAVRSRMHVTRMEERFPFSSYLLRTRHPVIAQLAQEFDRRLGGRPGTMFYYVAERNYYSADDVAYAVRKARDDIEDRMSDEEFLAYLEAAAREIERALAVNDR